VNKGLYAAVALRRYHCLCRRGRAILNLAAYDGGRTSLLRRRLPNAHAWCSALQERADFYAACYSALASSIPPTSPRTTCSVRTRTLFTDGNMPVFGLPPLVRA